MRSIKLIMPAVVVAVSAAVVLWVSPDVRGAILSAVKLAQGTSTPKPDDHGHSHGAGKHAEENIIKLSADQIARSNIELAAAGKGILARRLTVTGTIGPDADRVARVAAKVVGTVAELRKRLGDTVAKGEVVAVLDSREVADAKSDYLAALVTLDLHKTLFEREQTLFERKISAEQQFIRARSTFTEAKLRVDVARQKLSALDLNEADVANLSLQKMETLRHKELRAPLAGQIVERRVDLGAPVGGEGQEKELYVLADLSVVWVEMSVPASDLPSIKVGQAVTVSPVPQNAVGEGKIIFISPLLNADTRSARVIAEMTNKTMAWRSGSFVTAHVIVQEEEADIVVPRAALQSIAGENVLFVQIEGGFEKREVVLGRMDEKNAEIVFGLDPGEMYAATNTFVLKAELGKSEADHGHAH
jgi:cobalt-zinc-cadmium efflux system membrane fusion protein